jgi:hypothetical protein
MGQTTHETVPYGRRHALEPASFADQVRGGQGSKNRQDAQAARQRSPYRREKRRGTLPQQLLRLRVRAMLSSVDERPQGAGLFCLIRRRSKQARADAEQKPTALHQRFGLRIAPGEWLEQREPCILEQRQFVPTYASRQELCGNRLHPWLCGELALIELVEALSPPRQSDGAEPRIAARRHNIGKREVDLPQGGECRPDCRRQLFECDRSVVVELALSDR